MNSQLERIETEIRAAQERLRALSRTAPLESWTIQPAPDRWSIAQCVEHLNVTAEAFLPELRSALQQAGDAARRADRRYRRDLQGWLLSIVMPPPVRLARVRTPPRFQPKAQSSPVQLMKTFDDCQELLVRALHEADGLPLNEMMIQSPFSPRARYNAYSCFIIIVRHEHRHLWQAEQVAAAAAGR